MSSIFYKARFERRFPLSLLFLERLHTVFGDFEQGEPQPEKLVLSRIKGVLTECEIVDSPDNSDAAYVMERLMAMMKEAEKDSPSPPSSKKTFASSYAEWANKLTPDTTCLVAACFDYQKAEWLHRCLDRDDVAELARQYLTYEWEKIKVGYESVVYGFGGSYKDDSNESDENTRVFDMTKDNSQGMAALKGLF